MNAAFDNAAGTGYQRPRDQFGVQLPLNVLAEHPTVECLATLLRDHAGPLSGPLSGPLVAIQDGDGSRPPLFLVHPDDGQVGPYCRLAYGLGEEFAVSGLQAEGLYAGPVDVFGQPPATAALPATAVLRTHECGTDRDLADALRELIG